MYKVEKIDGKFCVIETLTEQVIRSCSNHTEAHSFYRLMKKGRGFQGNTPPFFLKEFKVVNS